MKKHIIGAIILLTVVFVGCSPSKTVNPDTTMEVTTPKETVLSADTIPSLSTEESFLHDRIPMVMVDSVMYYDTGKESTVTRRCGVMDGEITSTVEQTQIPTENDQSNFGSDYEYQYGLENTLEIFMNDKWYVFASRDSYDGKIQYGEDWYSTKTLSDNTIEWLYTFHSLSPDKQLAISYIPTDLLALMDLSYPQANETFNP